MEGKPISRYDLPDYYLEKWQKTVDLMARILDVPAGLIMRVAPKEIEVLIASNTRDNPYEPNEKADLDTGLYCETVMKTRSQLYVKNALESERWKNNPDIALGMYFYLGVPLVWPDGTIFGTICVLDRKKRSISDDFQKLLWQFKGLVEADFQLILQERELNAYRIHLENLVERRTNTLKNEIAERKKVEEELKLSEKRLKEAQRLAHIGNWELDLEQNRLFWSDEIYHIFGINKEEFETNYEGFLSIVHPDDREMVDGAYLESITTHRPYKLIHRIIRKNDGEIRYVREQSEEITDDRGRPIRSIGIVQDITEQKKVEEQLQQAQKMEAIGLLTGGIAHDFNNILTTIIGNANIALMEEGINEAIQGNIEQIEIAGNKAAVLTRQLLTFSRKQVIQPEILDLNTVFYGMKKMLRRMIGEDIEILMNPAPDLWDVEIDQGQVEQVIMNLAVNARDAMPQGGQILVETANIDVDNVYWSGNNGIRGPHVMLSVTDTGIGMDQETQKHIFEPFYTTKKEGEGTGLGLSTVYGIAQQNRGVIRVESRPGQGAVFRVCLPAATAHRNKPPEQAKNARNLSDGGNETILLVEDDQALRDLAKRVLTLKGYDVLEAADGEEALKINREHGGRIDLLISDVVMPKMGGMQIADSLEKDHPRIKIVYMSGYTDNKIALEGLLSPGRNFLQKPFSPERLVRMVRGVLDN
ncbi:MAG: response regulator [Desulfobacter sp.]|nr:MAG: response regulator [Desulfobacter sp.]